MDNCIHKVVDHHEGSCYLGVGSHEGQALKLSIVWAPGPGKARSIYFTEVKGCWDIEVKTSQSSLVLMYVGWVEIASVCHTAHIKARQKPYLTYLPTYKRHLLQFRL